MAHEVELLANGKFAFVGTELPWWQGGTVIDVKGTEDIGLTKEQVYAAVPELGMQVEKVPLFHFVPDPHGVDDLDGERGDFIEIDSHMAVRREDNKVVGVNGATYGVVQQDDCVDLAAAIHATGEARIVSAMLLREGSQFVVCCEVGETQILDDDKVAKYLFVASSHNGTLPLIAARSIIRVVCANTLSAGLWDSKRRGTQIRMRHSRNVMDNLNEARKVLRITAESFNRYEQWMHQLVETEVTNREFDEMMAAVFPEDKDATSKRALTVRDNARDTVRMLYNDSIYVDKYKGTAWGAFQAVNTWEHWGTTVRKTKGATDERKVRAERHMTGILQGNGEYSKVALEYLGTLNDATVAG